LYSQCIWRPVALRPSKTNCFATSRRFSLTRELGSCSEPFVLCGAFGHSASSAFGRSLRHSPPYLATTLRHINLHLAKDLPRRLLLAAVPDHDHVEPLPFARAVWASVQRARLRDGLSPVHGSAGGSNKSCTPRLALALQPDHELAVGGVCGEGHCGDVHGDFGGDGGGVESLDEVAEGHGGECLTLTARLGRRGWGDEDGFSGFWLNVVWVLLMPGGVSWDRGKLGQGQVGTRAVRWLFDSQA